MPDRRTAREEYLTEVSRLDSDAEHALSGAEHVVDERGQLLFMFTEEQIEHARKMMAEDRQRTDQRTKEFPEAERTKPSRIMVEMADQFVEINNEPLSTFENLLQAKRVIENRYPSLVQSLPVDHPWRQAKITHELIAGAGLQNVLAGLSRDMKEENYYLLLLLAGSHDIGRPVLAKKKLGLLPSDGGQLKTDGAYAAELLEEWGALKPFPAATRDLILHAVIHHSDRATPELPKEPSETDKLKYVFTSAVRDLDKLSTFHGKTDLYLFDDEEKRKQNEVGGFEGEQGRINPPELIDDFKSMRPLDRQQCKSYEAYMLSYLAWIFDLKLRDSLKATVASGMIEKTLRYLRSQLVNKAEYEQIDAMVNEFLVRHGLVTGRR